NDGRPAARGEGFSWERRTIDEQESPECRRTANSSILALPCNGPWRIDGHRNVKCLDSIYSQEACNRAKHRPTWQGRSTSRKRPYRGSRQPDNRDLMEARC